RDAGQAPLRTEPPLWTLQLGTSPIRGEDTPGLRGTDGKIYHVIHASDDAYHVVDPAAGRLLWSGSVGRRHVLEVDERQHAVIAPLDSALQWRAVEDGRELMRWQAPAEIGRTLRCDDSSLLVTTKDGALVCVDRANARTRWTWSKRGAEIDVSLADGRILVFDRTSSTLTALSSDRGQPVWARAVKPMRAFGGCRRVGQMTALVGADEVELIDASSGAMYMRVSLPSDGGGEQNRPMHLAHVDGEHFLVQRGDSIHAISTRDARIEWTTVLAGEHLVMHMTAPGRMYLETSSGKLLGLSMPTGQLTWEWWSGGFMQHLLPAMTARLSFIDWRLRLLVMQERPGSPLCLFDTATSAAVARLALPPGFTVTRIIDDGARLLVLGRDPQMTVTLLALPRAENLMPFGHD
ncbi:MAG: hypothetical protein EB084_14535, partial [Proteobacteria bacterium]|nr:hypothetical protein [Pseudomonadota bacterium]